MPSYDTSGYADKFSQKAANNWLKDYAKKFGHLALTQFFKLWILLIDGHASPMTKTIVLAALGYVISPVDAIPDFIPVVGLSDDVAVVGAAVASVACEITPEITRKAEAKASEWVS